MTELCSEPAKQGDGRPIGRLSVDNSEGIEVMAKPIDEDPRRSDREYREGLMTGLLITLANQVGPQWSAAITIVALAFLTASLWRDR